MSNVSFKNWTDAVRRSYLARHGVADGPPLDQDAAYAAWMAGTPAGTYASSLPAPVRPVPPSSGSISAPTQAFAAPPAWSRPVTDEGRPARVMWTLTAFAMLLGVLCAFLYAREELDPLLVVERVALLLDLPACVLALVCLCRPSIRVQGLAKIGWEIALGLSVYFVTIGLARDTGRVYRQGYNKGGASGSARGFDSGAQAGYQDGVSAGVASGSRAGYDDGYHDGFNAGAERQLSHDRAAVGGY